MAKLSNSFPPLIIILLILIAILIINMLNKKEKKEIKENFAPSWCIFWPRHPRCFGQ